MIHLIYKANHPSSRILRNSKNNNVIVFKHHQECLYVMETRKKNGTLKKFRINGRSVYSNTRG